MGKSENLELSQLLSLDLKKSMRGEPVINQSLHLIWHSSYLEEHILYLSYIPLNTEIFYILFLHLRDKDLIK